MKKSLTLLFITLLFFQVGCNTEKEGNIVTPNNYIKIIEGNGEDEPIAIRALSDGTILVVSNIVSFEQGERIRKIRLLKLNLQGEVMLEKPLPDNNNENWAARDVIILENNDVLVASTIQNSIGEDTSLLFYQINENLDSVRASTYQNEATYNLYGVEESANELIFTAQEFKSSNNSYPIIGKLNTDNLQVQEEVKEAVKYNVSPATKAYRNQSGEYVWAYNRLKSYLAQVQPNLLQINDQEIFIRNSDSLRAEKLLMIDNNPIVFGEIIDNDRTQIFYYDHSSQNSVVFGTSSNTLLNNVQRAGDGFLVTGFQDLQIAGTESRRSNFFLSRRNENGGEIFSRTFGSNENEELSDAVMINGGIYSIGKTVFGGENTLLLIKTDAFGRLEN